MTENQIIAKRIIKDCLTRKENLGVKVEPVKEPFSDWMQDFISHFPPTFFEARENKLVYSSLVITRSVYGMYSLTFHDFPLFVQEVTHHQFFRAKWSQVNYREMHTFEEAMKIFAGYVVLNQFSSYVKWHGFKKASLDGRIFTVDRD